MLSEPGIRPTSDIVDPNRSYGMDGFEEIHDPDKYKRIPPLNQEKTKMGTISYSKYLTTEDFPNNMIFILFFGGKK